MKLLLHGSSGPTAARFFSELTLGSEAASGGHGQRSRSRKGGGLLTSLQRRKWRSPPTSRTGLEGPPSV
eukprot:2257915-Pyramimonas_sp.AAC.1